MKETAYVSIYAGRVNINSFPTVIHITVEAFFNRLVGRKHIEMRGSKACVHFVSDNIEHWMYAESCKEICEALDFFASRNPDAFRQIILTMIAELTCDYRPTDARVSFMGIVSEVEPANTPA